MDREERAIVVLFILVLLLLACAYFYGTALLEIYERLEFLENTNK